MSKSIRQYLFEQFRPRQNSWLRILDAAMPLPASVTIAVTLFLLPPELDPAPPRYAAWGAQPCTGLASMIATGEPNRAR